MISVVTIISNAIRLDYPFQPWLECNAPVASEIVINVDSTCQDGTVELVRDLTHTLENVRILESPWNWENRVGGSELAIQSNLAIELCTQPWVLYIQADEVLHEQQHPLLKATVESAPADVTVFNLPRLYFWGRPDTIRMDWTHYLPRLFRRGSRSSSGDAMYTSGSGKPVPSKISLFHYSRMGDPAVISKRIATLDSLYHPQNTIQETGPYDYALKSFDSFSSEAEPDVVPGKFARYNGDHPASIVRWFRARGVWDESE